MRPDASHQPSASPVYRFVSAGVHRCSGGLTVGSDGHRRRLPRIRGIRSSGVCSASGASTYSTASGLIRTPTVLATPSVSVPLNLQPRLSREFPASASVPTAELRMFQPIFPYDFRRFISFHISVFFCRPSHFSFTNLVRSLAVARAGLHSVFLLSSLRCRKAITLASFSSLRPHF